MQANAYLSFDGRCAEAFAFYARCLGGEVFRSMTYAESPMAEHMPAGWRDKIIHARLRFGDTVLMGSDSPPEHYKTPAGMRVSLTTDAPDEAERVFAALQEGAAVEMPLQETFWALRFGMLTDRFGTPWMVNCERPA